MPELKKIMLVEDEPDIQTVARISLEQLGGFTLRVCSGGEEALNTIPGFLPDLILLDVMMPGMDGPHTLKALRENPATSSIPVIFMTAKVQPADVSHYRSLGAVGIIPKPFDPMTLSQTVGDIWRGAHG
ncbi:MAG: response regulator [Deltaproteobacteria bacterium]|nr:response regulator [Deltaproteobacteria bacterium]